MCCLLFLLAVCMILNLNLGYIAISFKDFLEPNSPFADVASLRINRVLAMLLAGISIPTSGFILQEYFQNPLAGPSVLGITSVSSLAVAFYIFLADGQQIPEFLNNSFMGFTAILGSIGLMLVLLALSGRFSNRSFLIIFGFLISALTGAVVSILQLYGENQSLKNYILWSFGANNILTRNQILFLAAFILIGLSLSLKTIKPLIGSALGTAYAQSLGINLRQLKYLVIISTSLLSASVTAFLGPILFIGIVVPHFTRLLYNPSQLWHQWLLNMALGAVIMEIFSIFSELTQLPLNIISSLFGIPVILMMMMRKRTQNQW